MTQSDLYFKMWQYDIHVVNELDKHEVNMSIVAMSKSS